ncbi:MAG: hypothetical protein EBZ67_14135 [Chitinophagia bacterium]|nr:hypothetical protein [Chitinophagia bacterium]
MFRFEGKTVYIISLERWGVMKISKHHYAMELAARGCRVYFIESPDLSVKGVRIEPCADHPNIRIVRYGPVTRGRRFLPGFLYALLVRWQVRLLVDAIGPRPDVVICFRGDVFDDLQRFGASLNIYFVADLPTLSPKPALPEELASADLILAVSKSICRKLTDAGYKVSRINHGLQPVFEDMAKRLELPISASGPTNRRPPAVIGYSGNLLIDCVDRDAMLEVIRSHPGLRFIFWGNCRTDDSNLFGLMDDGAEAFLNALREAPNVTLRGPVPAAQLAEEMRECDLFWICYLRPGITPRDNSNTHKILEYLATGKPVISRTVSDYTDTGLLHMLPDERADDYPAFFSQVLEGLSAGEDPGIVEKRIHWALDNTYTRQLDRIEAMVNAGRP